MATFTPLKKFTPKLLRTNNNSASNAGINFVDNTLTEYDTYTYKWTLYLGDPEIHNNPGNNPLDNAIIISESGNSARFFIENVKIDQWISINSTTRNMGFTPIKFSIHEPKGVSFMDSLLKAVKSLAIPNHLKAPYYLRLDFWGYDSEGNVVLIEEASRLWSIQILNMQTSVTTDGSIYNFDSIAVDDLATMNYYSIAPFTIRIDHAITVQDFFERYQNTMNDFYEIYRGILYQEADKITFIVDDEIKDLKFGGSSSDPTDMKTTLSENDDENIINLPKGTSVDTIVENLMIATKEWEQKIQKPIEPGKRKIRDEFTEAWVVETEIEYLNYDISRQDYARHYKFYIFSRKLSRNGGDIEKGGDQHISNLMNNFDIKKIYHYIFTGLNTEVLSFDFNLELMWYTDLPLHMGEGTGHLSNSGRQVDELEKLPRTRQEIKNELLQSTAKFQTVKDDPSAATTRRIQEGRSSDLRKELDQTVNPSTGLTGEQERRLNERINQSRNARTSARFVEDLDNVNVSDPFKQSNTPTTSTDNTLIYSIRYDPSREDLTKLFGFKGDKSKNRLFTASYLNYYNNAEMVQIDLEIRGDPFWIHRSKFERRALGNTILPKVETSNDRVFDPLYRDNLFVLNIKSPKPENEDGFYEVEDNDLYTGIYHVIHVENTFENGQFIQKLTAIKDAMTDLRSLRKRIE